MKKFLIGACLLAGGLFLPNDAHADTVYTYTVYSYSAPVHEPYTYEVSVQEIYEYLEMVHGDDFAYDGVLSKSTNGYRAKSACDDCHGDGGRGSGNDNGNGNEGVRGNAPDQVVVTGGIIRQVPISIPVYIPTEPAINIGFPTINTSTPIQPPSVYQEEEPVTCTPEMDLLAQQMRKALEEAGTTLSEIGGLLFVNADGSLGVSPWVRGEPVTPTTNPVVKIFTAVVPTGATVIGGWHTHPTGTWGHDPATGAYTQAGQYFSEDDYSIANSEYVGIRNGETVTSITRGLPGWLGLGLALNTPRRSGLYFLRDDAMDTNKTNWTKETIMKFADDISHCGL